MEGSRIDLKTFLGLAKPNQYSQSARKQISCQINGVWSVTQDACLRGGYDRQVSQYIVSGCYSNDLFNKKMPFHL